MSRRKVPYCLSKSFIFGIAGKSSGVFVIWVTAPDSPYSSNSELCVLVLPLVLGLVDYQRTSHWASPFFCFPIAGLSDGGTVMYLGWGYCIRFWHRMIRVVDAEGEQHLVGYKIGPRLTFWFQLGKENTWFEQVQPAQITIASSEGRS